MMNFEDYQKDALTLLHDVCEELAIDNEAQGARIFRSVLHAIRDRLPVNEAIHLSAQLPIIWKGIYFDGYHPSGKPVKIRHAAEWLEFIRLKNDFGALHDFPTDLSVSSAFSCIMHVLDRHLDPGQMIQLRQALNAEILELV